jgi:hypothetical protein
VQVGEEALDLLALGAALAENPGGYQGVVSGGGVVGTEGAGPDDGPRCVFAHEERR